MVSTSGCERTPAVSAHELCVRRARTCLSSTLALSHRPCEAKTTVRRAVLRHGSRRTSHEPPTARDTDEHDRLPPGLKVIHIAAGEPTISAAKRSSLHRLQHRDTKLAGSSVDVAVQRRSQVGNQLSELTRVDRAGPSHPIPVGQFCFSALQTPTQLLLGNSAERPEIEKRRLDRRTSWEQVARTVGIHAVDCNDVGGREPPLSVAPEPCDGQPLKRQGSKGTI